MDSITVEYTEEVLIEHINKKLVFDKDKYEYTLSTPKQLEICHKLNIPLCKRAQFMIQSDEYVRKLNNQLQLKKAS